MATQAPLEDPIPATPVEPYEGRFALRSASLRHDTARGTIVNAVFLIAISGLGLIKGFVVAGFIATSDYGVWGLLAVALGTLMWLKQVGINDKYIQQDEADQELAFQRAFTLEAAFTTIFLALMLALLPLYALLYGRSEILAPGFVATLVMPAIILQTPIWVFYRRMDFVRQRRLQAIDPIVSFVVTIALAIAGTGYWSLVVGMVAGSWASALVALRASPYPLVFRYDRGTLREYARFSWPLFIAGLTGIAVAQGSVIAGEKVLGLAAVGAITLASSIAVYTNRVDEIVTQTLYPAICAVRDRADLMLESFVKSNRLALMWGVPFGIGVTLFAPDLVDFGIGEKWRPAVGLIQAFGAIAAANHIGFNWHAFYRARGETRPVAVNNVLILIAFGAVAVPLLSAHGLDGFAWGMAIMTAVGLLARTYYLVRLFPAFQMAKHSLRAITPTIPAAGAVLLARALEGGERTLGVAIAELVLYGVVTIAATLVVERALLREVLGYLRQAPAPAPGPQGAL